jgi:hypothetical protein
LVLARAEHPTEEDVSFVVALEDVTTVVEEDEAAVVLDVVVVELLVTDCDIAIDVDDVVEEEIEEELTIGLIIEK